MVYRLRKHGSAAQMRFCRDVNARSGNYDFTVLCRNCDKESPDAKLCTLTGSVPEWLSGSIIYNGPGLNKFGDDEYKHAFDAAALLQKFNISKGDVTYANRYLRSKTFEQNSAAGKITKAEFGTPAPADKGMFSRLFDAMDTEKMFSDNTLVCVTEVNGKHYAMSETPFMTEIDTNTLETQEKVNINKLLGLMTQSPHPITDKKDGSTYTVGMAVGMMGPKYNILKFQAGENLKKAKVVASISSRWRMSPAYIHSLGMTENYVIVLEQPMACSVAEMTSNIVKNAAFIEGLQWHASEPVLFHVIDRRTWKRVNTRYIADPFFFIHIANSYEDGDHIVMDIPTYKDSSMLQSMFIKTIRDQKIKNDPEFGNSFKSYMHRVVIPLNTSGGGDNLISLEGSKCTATLKGTDVVLSPVQLSDVPMENPTVNPKIKTLKHRYIWAMGPDPQGGDLGFVAKVDTSSGETTKFSEAGLYPSEPVFIPKPNSTDEDDGVIAVLCIKSGDEKCVLLLILDAASMQEVARGTCSTPGSIPIPLHGHFIPIS
ncbi:unnamed protein product, partial [Meganyctiphanes norvegica]